MGFSFDEMFGPQPVRQTALVGEAFEGAERLQGRLQNWDASRRPVNDEILPAKKTLDARVRDMGRNEGSFATVVALSKNHIVGEQYLLNAKPNSRLLFGTEDDQWERDFADEVEMLFMAAAESPNFWLDATRQNTLSGLVRLAIGSSLLTGEVLGTAEWMPDDGRPCRSAMMLLDPDRLSNPNGQTYASNIVGGVERDRRGAPIAYHITDRHPSDFRTMGALVWRRVMARKPNWGRQNVLHIFEQHRPDQARGVSALIAALGEIKMLREFRKVELQRAVVAATYAATIESDMPPADVYVAMGAGSANPAMDYMAQYLEAVGDYVEGSKTLRMDGVKIPSLPPGTHLKIQNPGAQSPLGSDFETATLRYLAGVLGVSYEQLSRDFSKTNYSSGKAAMAETERHLSVTKRTVADRTATFIYRLWLEEMIATDQLQTLRRRRVPSFYDGLNAEAFSACAWIGAGAGQVDELKETQAAALRLRLGLSTMEREIKQLSGEDWRAVMRQRAREKADLESWDLPSHYDTEPTDAENAAAGATNGPQETAE